MRLVIAGLVGVVILIFSDQYFYSGTNTQSMFRALDDTMRSFGFQV